MERKNLPFWLGAITFVIMFIALLLLFLLYGGIAAAPILEKISGIGMITFVAWFAGLAAHCISALSLRIPDEELKKGRKYPYPPIPSFGSEF